MEDKELLLALYREYGEVAQRALTATLGTTQEDLELLGHTDPDIMAMSIKLMLRDQAVTREALETLLSAAMTRLITGGLA